MVAMAGIVTAMVEITEVVAESTSQVNAIIVTMVAYAIVLIVMVKRIKAVDVECFFYSLSSMNRNKKSFCAFIVIF